MEESAINGKQQKLSLLLEPVVGLPALLLAFGSEGKSIVVATAMQSRRGRGAVGVIFRGL